MKELSDYCNFFGYYDDFGVDVPKGCRNKPFNWIYQEVNKEMMEWNLNIKDEERKNHKY